MNLILEESVLIQCVPEEGDRTLIVPEGVERIQDNAFALCTEITAILLPKSLRDVGLMHFPDAVQAAFRYCTALREIQIDPAHPHLLSADGLLYERGDDGPELLVCPQGKIGEVALIPETVSIGNSAFQDCCGITDIALPEGLTHIWALAFADCTSLRTLRIPESVTYISGYAFAGCKELESIVLPRGMEELAEGLFQGCSALKSLMIPDGVQMIGRSALTGCSSLRSLRIPEGVEFFGNPDPEYGNREENPFSLCPSLSEFLTDDKSKCYTEDGLLYYRHNDGGSTLVACPGATVGEIAIPEGVTEILSKAFEGCRGVTSVSLPGTVKYVGDYAFRNCPALKGIRVDKENPVIFSDDGLLFIRNTEQGDVWLDVCPGGKTGMVTIPEGVTAVSPHAFSNCMGITDVRFPETVWGIGWNAFENCTGLRKVILTEGLKVIRQEAFAGCRSLERVYLPESLRNLSNRAFPDCSAEVVLPESMSVLGGRLPEAEKPDFGKYWYPESLNRTDCYARLDTSAEEITVPDGVKTILSGAFNVDRWTPPVRLRLPRSVASIDTDVFDDIPTIQDIIVDKNNPIFYSQNGALFERSGNGTFLPIFRPPKE